MPRNDQQQGPDDDGSGAHGPSPLCLSPIKPPLLKRADRGENKAQGNKDQPKPVPPVQQIDLYAQTDKEDHASQHLKAKLAIGQPSEVQRLYLCSRSGFTDSFAPPQLAYGQVIGPKSGNK